MIESLAGAKFLIMGGAGSFGRTMVRQLLAENAAQVHVLSRDAAEQDEMRQTLGNSRVRFFLGDVRDRKSVDTAMGGVDFVFHAATLKQVPSCEFLPDHAVKTNVVGRQHVIESARANSVRSVVCLSTDKTVHPVNAMGMTKVLMEKNAQVFARNDTSFPTTVSVTGYGNVMYNRGSVIPLFVNQIRQRKPIALTEPRMTRFLMSLDESVALLKHAFVHAEPGDLFVKREPACTVETLARAVAELMEVEPDLRTIGIRNGARIYQTLRAREEMVKAIDQGDYFRVSLDARSLDYSKYVEDGYTAAVAVEDYDSNNTQQMSLKQTKALVATVPQMQRAMGV